MSAEVVFAASVEGVTAPRRDPRPLTKAWTRWCDEQGIDPAYVTQLTVTRDEDDSLTAHLTRFETLPDEQWAKQQFERPFNSRVVAYNGNNGVNPCSNPEHKQGFHVHYVTSDVPVSSIQLLLDHLDDPTPAPHWREVITDDGGAKRQWVSADGTVSTYDSAIAECVPGPEEKGRVRT